MEGQNNVEEKMTRRRFLDVFIGGTFAATGVFAISGAVAYILPPKKTGGGGGEKTEIAPVDKLSPGTAIKAFHQGKPVIVGQTKQGKYFALDATCTHLDCVVSWHEATGQIVCPCHAAFFDTNGAVLSGPAPKPLPSYPINIVNGKVYVG